MKFPPVLAPLGLRKRAFAGVVFWLLGAPCLQAAEPSKDGGRGSQGAVQQSGPEADATLGTPVTVTQAAPACFSAAVRVTGFLAPRASAIVALALEGYEVAEVLAGEGDIVSDGQPLARLSRIGGDASAAGSAQTAGDASAARPGRAAGEAGAARGGAAGSASALPSSIVLRAPAPGLVVKSAARPGAAYSPRGEPLFRLAIDGLIEVDVEVSSIDLSSIKEDQNVRIEIERGHEVNGRVRKVASEIDPVTQMGHVRVAIPRDPALRAGRFVRATIDARQSCGISVPRSAVLYKTDGTSVQVVRGHLIETLRVRVGILSEHDAEIQEGLRSGELVVANAGASLRDGDRVSPVLSEDAGPSTGLR
ncbi:efflux RND transporter periplasmic adaptor subunit [Methylocapsa aurea]|uniref:efflux RND transporter periplasmic adaptor subunit n=1 Tax=Methylocapsa aurea TaxID=663610 RepID=UPI00068E1227|nr:efflux RND transporter periplasmic adaptor subunit [Methylocapsa aurea]